MKYYFSKIKSTSSFFYKSIKSATVTQLDDRFEVNVFPLLMYHGIYCIHSIEKNAFGVALYKTMLSPDGDTDFRNMVSSNTFFITISNDKRKVKIYNPIDLSGIILKA